LLWWRGINLFFILLHFALMMGYLFVFHFITFCSDGGVFICFSFYTPPSEQNLIKWKTNKYPTIREKCNKLKKNKYPPSELNLIKIIFFSDGGVFICFSFYYILLWWRGIYLFFILLHFALIVGYLFVFHFITFWLKFV
jgi:hypothetical protein